MGALADLFVKVRPDTSAIGPGVRKAGNDAGRTFSTSFDNASKKSIGGGKALAGVAASGVVALGALATAGATVGLKTAAGMETARIGFTTMLGSAQKADKFLKQLSDFASKTPFEFPELQTAASSLISAGVNANKVIPIMTTLGDVTAGMGTGSEGIRRATVALQQMQAAGRITGEDLNQLRDAGIPVYDLLASATGKSKEEVVKLAQAGKLGKKELDAMMKALETGKGLERFNGLMEKTSTSMSGLFSTLKDSINIGLAQAIQPLIPLIKSGLSGAIAVLGDVMPKVATGLQTVVGGFRAFGAAFRAADGDVTSTGFAGFMERLANLLVRLKPLWVEVVGGFRAFGAAFRAADGDVTSSGFAGNMERLANLVRLQVVPALRQFGQFFTTHIIPALRVVAQFIISEVVPRFFAIQRAVLELYAVVVPIIRQIVGAVVGQFMKMRPQIMSIWTSVKEIITGVMFVIREVITSVTNIIRMIWDRWGKQITAVVTTVFRGLVNIISGVMKAIAGIIKLAVALIKGDWSGAWNAIKQIFSGVWQAIRGILTVATAALRATLAAWWARVRSLWTSAQTAVRSAWTGFWTGVRNTASTMMESVRSRVATVLGRIRDAFRTTVGNIKTIWNGVKTAVSAPVEWIKNNVYNKPLVPVWNRVAALVSGPKLSAYAEGGPITGPRHGRDNVLGISRRGTATAMVEPGEWIGPRWMAPLFPQLENIRKRGRSALQDVGDPKRLPGFAGGGIVGWAKGLASSVGSKVGNLKDWALGGLRDLAAKVLDPVKGLIDKAMPSSGVGTTVGGIGKKAIDLILDKIKTEDAAAMPALGGPAGSAIASGGWASIYRALRGAGATSFTTYPGHDQGASRSRDVWPASAGNRVSEVARRLSSIWYVIWNRRIASITTGRRWIPYRRSNPHTDHVHVTLRPGVKAAKGGIANFDNGGVFKPGLNLAYNGTGRDELLRPVRNGRVGGGAATIAQRPITIMIDLGDGLVQRVQGLIDENDEFRATVGRTR